MSRRLILEIGVVRMGGGWNRWDLILAVFNRWTLLSENWLDNKTQIKYFDSVVTLPSLFRRCRTRNSFQWSLRYFTVFINVLKEILRYYLKVGHDRCLLCSSRFYAPPPCGVRNNTLDAMC